MKGKLHEEKKELQKMSDYKLNTRCVQGGYTPGNGEPRQIPIIQSTTFKYDTSEDMGRLFDLEAEGYFYTRLQLSLIHISEPTRH